MFGTPDDLPAALGLLISFAITVAGYCMWASGWPGGDDQ